MATKEAVSVGTYVIPRVNLLPPEIGVKRAERRSYAFMGVAVAGAVAAVAAMYLGQASRVSAAEAELAQTEAEGTKLRSDRAKLQSVEDAYAARDAGEALLTQAYARRINWSVYLHNIGLTIPENVWITTMATTAAPTPVAGTESTAVAGMTFAGTGFAYNDVAAWLDSIIKIKGVANATFSTATDVKPSTPSGRTLVTFSSSASLMPAAVTPHKVPGSR